MPVAEALGKGKKTAENRSPGGPEPKPRPGSNRLWEPPGQEWDRMPRRSATGTSGLLPAESASALGIAKAGVGLSNGPGPDATGPAAQR